MQDFEIYVYEDMDEFDYLSCRMEKFRLRVVAIKIDQYYYQVNFYHKEIIYKDFNTPESNIFYSLPGLIVVDSLELDALNKAVKHLINEKFFENLKKNVSFESIDFNIQGVPFKGKPLSSVKILPLS
jgi:hypothetical protein